MFECGPVKRVVVLGAAPIIPQIQQWGDSRGVDVRVLTSPDQSDECDVGNVFVTESLSGEDVLKFVREDVGPEEVLGLSLGARWIIKSALSKKLFDGKLLNAHGTRLPMDRGGGGHSWRIMRGDRVGNLVLHLIDDGIDTGPIVASEEYLVPRHCQTPQEVMDDYFARLSRFIIEFLEKVASGSCSCPLLSQPEYLSSYYPRLATPIHGWIDWRWDPHEIERFIFAFSDPYPGAHTMIGDEVALIGSAQLHVGETGHHPYQAGRSTSHAP